MSIIIGGAWPYANGSLHIGHLAALLPGDVLARYYRAKGEKVFYVSGSDCHGTPIMVRSKMENCEPKTLSDKYHSEFLRDFARLNFSYDLYAKTSDDFHKDFVKDFYLSLFESGSLFEKNSYHAYCKHCEKYLPGRYLLGYCSSCGHETTGGTCDYCGLPIDPETLLEPSCSLCGSTPVFKVSKHLYIRLKPFEDVLKKYLSEKTNWRPNTKKLALGYIREGLKNRATTRDLNWGISVPVEGFTHKKIYVWIEALIGYLSTINELAIREGLEFESLWNSSYHYYVHGKDNVPFHAIIFPSLLLSKGNLKLPDHIISSEHVTLNGYKISTSHDKAIWISEMLETYTSDSIRYYFLAKNPELQDLNFTISDFITTHNADLVGTYGNFVHRTLAFIDRHLNGIFPKGSIDKNIESKLSLLYTSVGSKLEQGAFRSSIYDIFKLIHWSNKYFDEHKPWITKESNLVECENVLYNCLHLIANFAILLKPILPDSSSKLINWFNLDDSWNQKQMKPFDKMPSYDVLFKKIDNDN
jgi:methionyl-tRNA synthetase